MKNALQDQRPAPLLPDAGDVVPVDVVAAGRVADRGAGEKRRAARGERVLEMRHALRHEGPCERAEQPARPHEAVPRQPQAGPQRRREAGAHVVFAVRPDGNVDRDDQVAKARAGDARHQAVDARRIARQVGLEPRIGRGVGHFFHRNERGAAHDCGNARRLRRLREHEVAAVGRQRADADRRDPEGRRVALAEQRDLLRAPGDIDQHPGQEVVRVERGAVGVQRAVVLRRAGDVAEQRARQPAPGRVLEVLQRQDAGQAPWCRGSSRGLRRRGARGIEGTRENSHVRHPVSRSVRADCRGTEGFKKANLW
ncbi:hypothetical protein D9M68_668730 [compost metagenome]